VEIINVIFNAEKLWDLQELDRQFNHVAGEIEKYQWMPILNTFKTLYNFTTKTFPTLFHY
jgi:hypothetical protein